MAANSEQAPKPPNAAVSNGKHGVTACDQKLLCGEDCRNRAPQLGQNSLRDETIIAHCGHWFVMACFEYSIVTFA